MIIMTMIVKDEGGMEIEKCESKLCIVEQDSLDMNKVIIVFFVYNLNSILFQSIILSFIIIYIINSSILVVGCVLCYGGWLVVLS